MLAPGTPATGTIELGDLDAYTFSANLGDKFAVVATDVAATAFIPRLVIYGPTGANLVTASGADAATTSFTAAVAGTFTAILCDASSGYGSTGDYSLLLTLK